MLVCHWITRGARRMSQPALRKVDSLVRHLKLGVGEPKNKIWGRTVFLIGAGCSLTAGIPTASGVAMICALELKERYEAEGAAGPHSLKTNYGKWKSDFVNFKRDAEQALDSLVTSGKVPQRFKDLPDEERWPALYTHFFEEHLTSINQQRNIINGIINEAEERLNWANVCLGELVIKGYIHTVLTTNFDMLAVQGIIRTGILPVIADGIESLNRVSAQPNRPQVVHLHGSMHTYNPRNTRVAVIETGKDPTLRSVLYNVLQNCDVFVVVGYAGGEEGVMDLLCEAAARMKSLVIYWVLYESEHARLSTGARRLMAIGENKFVLMGYDADILFRDIMKGLGIGQPDWMKQSLKWARDAENPVITPKEAEDEKSAPDIGIAVRAYWTRVKLRDGLDADKQDDLQKKKEQWAVWRLAGQDNKVLEDDMPGIPVDYELQLMRGLSAWSAAREEGRNPSSAKEYTAKAIKDFQNIVDTVTSDEGQRFTNYIRLLSALWFQYELTTGDTEQEKQESQKSLDKLDWRVEQAKKLFPRSRDMNRWGDIQINRARVLREKVRDDDIGEEAIRRLRRVIGIYRLVLRSLPATSYRRWAEAKAGLAHALQRYGEIREDIRRLREAVETWANLVLPNVSVAPKDHAGTLQNLSSALVELSKLDRQRATELLQEAKHRAENAVAIYDREGDPGDLDDARKLVGDIDLKLGESRQPPT
jgi:tetratricopeptide (TPR) repeat protein